MCIYLNMFQSLNLLLFYLRSKKLFNHVFKCHKKDLNCLQFELFIFCTVQCSYYTVPWFPCTA